jgi:hypothetical protein
VNEKMAPTGTGATTPIAEQADVTPRIPHLDDDTGSMDAALAYAAAGDYVLAVRRKDQGGGTGKNPGSVVGNRWHDKSTRDPKVIGAWFAGTDHGIAIDLGRGGLVVIDVDDPKLLPEWLQNVLSVSGAPYQSTRPDTPGRGHYVFRQPPGRVIGCGKGRLAGMGLDVKGDGGVIIVQPTHHPEGGEYRWITPGIIPVLPPPLAELLDDTADRESAATNPEVRAFLAQHTSNERPTILHGWRKHFLDATAKFDSRHDTMVATLPGAMEEAMAGFFPAAEAEAMLRTLFTEYKTGPYNGKAAISQAEADDEFNGMLAWAIAQAKRHLVEEIRARVEKRMGRPRVGTQAEFFGLGSRSSTGESPTNPTESAWQTVDGATFILDQPADVPAKWGDGKEIAWPEGEGLMIAGGQGLGKTTLAGQLLRGLLGLDTHVLGLPVTGSGELILYLAMDRPRQIARSLARQFTGADRELLKSRVLIRPGPPHADLAKYPELLLHIATELGAGIIFVDSLKDAAIGLSDDEVGASYNRARQYVLNSGRQICELHHVTKMSADTINDVYGSTWLTSGCGSVILLTGEPGDPIIGFKHLKFAVDEIGPYRLSHDPVRGRLTIEHGTDLVEMARAASSSMHGLTAKDAAKALFDTEKPLRGQIEKARRKLDELVSKGVLQRQEGSRGGQKDAGAAAWFIAT